MPHLFRKKIKIKNKTLKVFQNHASICKLGVFGYASSILKKKKKKEIIFSSKVKVFKIMLQFVD